MNINHVVSGASNALQIDWNEWNNAPSAHRAQDEWFTKILVGWMSPYKFSTDILEFRFFMLYVTSG